MTRTLAAMLFLLGSAPFALAQQTDSAGTQPTPSRGSDAPVGQQSAPTGDIIIADLRVEPVRVVGLQQGTVEDATSALSVLSQAELAVRDSGFVADALRAVPGVGVSRSGAIGGLTQVRIRGAEANHTVVLLNGIEVSDPLSGETDFGLISGIATQRIELARGEQSAVWGSGAIGGVVNIETLDVDGFAGRAEAGSFGTQRLEINAGLNGTGRTDPTLSVAVSDFQTDGVDTSATGGEEDGSTSRSVLASGELFLGPDWRVSGLARWGQSEVETDPDLDFDGRLDDADRQTDSEQVTVGGRLQGEVLDLYHVFSADWNRVERENFADGQSQNTATGTRTRLAASSRLDALVIAGGDLDLTALADHRIEDYEARDTEFGGFTNQDQTFRSSGLAGEARYSLGTWMLEAGLRRDFNDGRFEDATSWRVGTAWSPDFGGVMQVRLRAAAGHGIKNPTFTELFGFFPGSFVGNPDLQPESSTSAEIGVDVSTVLSGRGLSLSVTAFKAELEDEIVTRFLPGFLATPANSTGTSERDGLEASGSFEISDGVTLSAAASWIDASGENGLAEIRVPERTASLALDWRPDAFEGARLGFALDHVGPTPDTDFGTFQRVEVGDYTLFGVSGEWPLNERVSLTVRGENLFDQEVRDVFGFAQPGAGVFVGVRLR